jgi:hypothetical protein
MNIKTELLKEHSKAQFNRIADYIGADNERFTELLDLFLNEEYRITQRAAWVISTCVHKHPFLAEAHLDKMLKKLREPNIHDAVKRNIVRIMEDIELPDELLDEITDICFGYLKSNTEAYAIKAFAITVLGRVAKKIPELKPELQITLEDQIMRYQETSPAVVFRSKKELMKLRK